MTNSENKPSPPRLATFASGCFWCTEAVMKRLRGVLNVTSGYAGGVVPNPTYEQVSGGMTGHAEAVQVEYDAEVIPYERLLDVFFATHDPTTRNRQGNDIGPQYRSVIFYHSDEQRTAAERAKADLGAAEAFSTQIVTEILPAGQFYPAEADQQDFYARNRSQAYCQYVIDPKIAILRQRFAPHLRKEAEL